MTDYTQQVATTIINQLGGFGKLKAMINMRDLTAGEKKNGNSVMTFKFSGSRKFNMCEIELNGMDLYDIKLMKFSPKYCTISNESVSNDLFNDMLIEHFEGKTGLYLSL